MVEQRHETTKKTSHGCPIEALMEIIGGKWKPIILYYLFIETRRFGQLKRLIPNVSQRMLTQQLRELEADGVVHREVYKEVPPRVEYSLTPLGQTLEPLLNTMNSWAEMHISNAASHDLDTNRNERDIIS